MMAQELGFFKAFGVFHGICAFVDGATRDGLRIDEVEREVHARLAEVGRAFLGEFAEHAGDGNVGETVTCDGRVLRRSETPERRRYLSIYGEVEIYRYVYSAGKKKPIEYVPLDARLGLPAGEISYVLEDFQQRLSVKSPFAKGMEDLRAILGTAVSVATAERANQQMGNFAGDYYVEALSGEQTPPAAEEGELLVVAADGKGVPMRRTLEERLQAEREEAEEAVGAEQVCEGRSPTEGVPGQEVVPAEASCVEGEKPGGDEASRVSASADKKASRRAARKQRQRRQKALARKQAEERRCGKKAHGGDQEGSSRRKKGRKQMAYVGAVYTIDRFPRTVDDVLDEVQRRERAKERPRPQHKQVWGEMTRLQGGERIEGRSLILVELAVACEQRDPEKKKTWICLMDGEEPLWEAQGMWLDRAVPILDFFHALEHLGKVARVLYEGRAADAFVDHHARMLLEGKVDYAVRNLGRLLDQQKPRSAKAAELRRAIHYFRNNRDRMHYDEYLAQGYPIGSGVAEGTCRNLVKDRLELTGMKWEFLGAQAMIYLRALYLNGEWNHFIAYRVAEEQKQLYGKDTIYGKLTHYGQAA